MYACSHKNIQIQLIKKYVPCLINLFYFLKILQYSLHNALTYTHTYSSAGRKAVWKNYRDREKEKEREREQEW